MKINRHPVRVITDDYIYLEDSGFGRSITNSAEEIISRLHTRLSGIGRRRVFYRDSFGDIDELILIDGKFSGFRSGRGDPLVIQINELLQRQ